MKQFAVIGKPILHDHTHLVWNHAFQELGFQAHCFRINPIDAAKAHMAIRELRLEGCMITPPFDEDMLNYLDEADKSVRELGVVNTIKNVKGRLIGYNTDSRRIVELLKAHDSDPKGKRIVVLGIDKMTRTAIYGLLRAQAHDVVLLDRAYEKAIKTAERLGCRVAYFGRVRHEIEQAGILISCLSSNCRFIKQEWLKKKPVVCELCASPENHVLNIFKDAECQVISGQEHLFHRVIPALELFFDVTLSDYRIYFEQTTPVKKSTDSLAITGFMGAGKTMVSKHLARLTGKELVDTDTLIEEKAGESIPDIFRKYGEARFRELEYEVFEELDYRNKIISCGGGVVKNERIRKKLREHTLVVWLWSPLTTILSRIKKGTRPLLDVQNIDQKAKTIFRERIPLYADCADLMMVNESVSTRNVAKRIYREIYGKHHQT